MLVVLSGLPGVGKTTIARELAASMGAVLLRIDTIEHALRHAGSKVEGEGYSVAYAVAEDNLRLGRIVVADCVNPWPLTRDAWRSVADRAGVRTVDVEVVCSDPTSTDGVSSHAPRIWPATGCRHGPRSLSADYRPWNGDRLVIDTSLLDVEESVRRILSVAGSPK